MNIGYFLLNPLSVYVSTLPSIASSSPHRLIYALILFPSAFFECKDHDNSYIRFDSAHIFCCWSC